MDRFRYQSWKTAEDIKAINGGVPSNYQVVGGILEEIIPESGLVHIVDGLIIDLYICPEVPEILVALIKLDEAIYQVIVDNDQLTIFEKVTDNITYTNGRWKAS